MLAFDVRQLQQLTPAIMASQAHLFEAEDGLLPPSGQRFGAQHQSAWMHVWMGDAAQGVIEIRNADGDVQSRLSVGGHRGLHQVEWVLQQGAEDLPQGRGGFGRRNYVPAGTYTAVLQVGGVEHSTTFNVSRR